MAMKNPGDAADAAFSQFASAGNAIAVVTSVLQQPRLAA
jgi:hypothetical protein